jgi:chromosome segregation ATPase
MAVIEKEKIALVAQHANMAEQLNEEQERITELNRLHTQTQANLEHYRQSVHEQRLVEQQQFDNQKQSYLIEIKTLKDELIVAREKFTIANQQHQSLQQAYQALESTLAKQEAILSNQEKQLKEQDKSIHKHKQAGEHWENQCKSLQAAFDNTSKELFNSTAESKVIAHQLADAKLLVNELKTQAQLLMQEKSTLIQEKAHLEGQISQMQRLAIA